jgi:hypothetical protein
MKMEAICFPETFREIYGFTSQRAVMKIIISARNTSITPFSLK